MNHSNCSVLLLAANLSNDPHCVRPIGAGCSFCDIRMRDFFKSPNPWNYTGWIREESQQKLKVILPKWFAKAKDFSFSNSLSINW
jgi:hypothetical protein